MGLLLEFPICRHGIHGENLLGVMDPPAWQAIRVNCSKAVNAFLGPSSIELEFYAQ